MSIADIKALEGDDGGGGGGEDKPKAEAPAAEAAADGAGTGRKSAPVIHPAKIVDLEKDLAVKMSRKPATIPKSKEAPLPPLAAKDASPAKKAQTPTRMASAGSLNAPATPDRRVCSSLFPTSQHDQGI